MRDLFNRLLNDDRGFITSIEMLFIAVILVIGLIAGWAALRVSVVSELGAIGNAMAALDEGYFVDGLEGDTGGSNGTKVNHVATVTKITVVPTPAGVSDQSFSDGTSSSGPPGAP